MSLISFVYILQFLSFPFLYLSPFRFIYLTDSSWAPTSFHISAHSFISLFFIYPRCDFSFFTLPSFVVQQENTRPRIAKTESHLFVFLPPPQSPHTHSIQPSFYILSTIAPLLPNSSLSPNNSLWSLLPHLDTPLYPPFLSHPILPPPLLPILTHPVFLPPPHPRHPAAGGECGVGEFRCNDGGCIEETLKCDFTADCADQSDEVDCRKSLPYFSLYPHTQS